MGLWRGKGRHHRIKEDVKRLHQSCVASSLGGQGRGVEARREQGQDPFSFSGERSGMMYDVSQVPGPPSRVLLAGDARRSDYLAASGWQRFTPTREKRLSIASISCFNAAFVEKHHGRTRSPGGVDHLGWKRLGHSTKLIVRIVKAIRLIDGWIDGWCSVAHMGGTGRRDKSIGASTRKQ